MSPKVIRNRNKHKKWLPVLRKTLLSSFMSFTVAVSAGAADLTSSHDFETTNGWNLIGIPFSPTNTPH